MGYEEAQKLRKQAYQDGSAGGSDRDSIGSTDTSDNEVS